MRDNIVLPPKAELMVDPGVRGPLVLQAGVLGIAADQLLRGGEGGLAVPVWIALVCLTLMSLVWRSGRSLPRESAAWLLVSLTFALCVAWRDAEALQVLNIMATMTALGMAAVAASNAHAALLADRLRITIIALVRVAISVAIGFAPQALRELGARASESRLTRLAGPTIRAVLISGAVLLVFGSLLRGADAIFASFVKVPHVDLDVVMSHVILTGLFTWVAGGLAVATVAPSEPRGNGPLPFSLTLLDVTSALGALAVLFAAFVIAQLGWFFGGEAFLHSRTGLTAAQYARNGFFQMVWVVVLVVPVLLVTRAALPSELRSARRHTTLSVPIIALLFVMIASAALRMRLYVDYFGFTIDRFYTFVFMAWLAVVLAWLALTVLRGTGRYFAAGVAASGIAVLLGINLVSPDAFVARANVARAGVLDIAHLASLSGEAAEHAVTATLAATHDPVMRCAASTELLSRWGPASHSVRLREREGAWRTINLGDMRARAIVARHSAALRTVMHGCGPGR